MADIRAFRAFRYDLGRVGSLGDVTAPPYDVIDADLQNRLYARSPFNVIRLILNKEEPEDTEQNNRYTRASRLLHDWMRDGVLKQDSARAVYVYHQEFELESKRYARRGFMARVRLEKFGEGKVFPHEETMAGPKADRLKLFRATRMNLSQIFALYPDETGTVQNILDHGVGQGLPLQATDHLGVVSKIWPVTDQHVVSTVTGLMGPKPLFIADGHHRYETALRYLEECRHDGEARDSETPPHFVLMMLVSMSDPGLVILPTHRLVSGLSGLKNEQLRNILAEYFHVEVIGQGEKGANDTWELIQAADDNLLGFGTVSDGAWLTARLRSPEIMAELAPEHGPAWRALGVSVLHILVLDRLVSMRLDGQSQCRYVHLLREVTEDMKAGRCQLAVLVPPARMTQVERIAGNLEKMPPKSTYFYPKLLSGLVFNPLATH